ncbi:MAG TPA: hypothetical protein PLB97_10090 [Accumulibacter sp.]|nr:hypothetical protein [Accumulibacter sp.]
MKICFALPTANQWRMAVLGSIFLLMADSPVCAVESTLGRLFFSAERRQQLDRQREQNTLDKQQAVASPALSVDGVVVRSSGRRTTWLNGTPQHENEMLNGLTLTGRPGEPARVLVESHDAPTTRARVGETVNRSTGEISDRLNGGHIRVRSSARKL